MCVEPALDDLQCSLYSTSSKVSFLPSGKSHFKTGGRRSLDQAEVRCFTGKQQKLPHSHPVWGSLTLGTFISDKRHFIFEVFISVGGLVIQFLGTVSYLLTVKLTSNAWQVASKGHTAGWEKSRMQLVSCL